MKKVFIGGSRKISYLNEEIRQKLENIIKKSLFVDIGDANGVDKAVQLYFKEHHYNKVEVFCMKGTCRNNLGGWQTRSISAINDKKNFDYYSTKDKAMADEASVGFMIWDGKSIGTLTNIFRLVNQNKRVIIYTVPLKQFADLKDTKGLDEFLSTTGNDFRQKVEQITSNDSQEQEKPLQRDLFVNHQVSA